MIQLNLSAIGFLLKFQCLLCKKCNGCISEEIPIKKIFSIFMNMRLENTFYCDIEILLLLGWWKIIVKESRESNERIALGKVWLDCPNLVRRPKHNEMYKNKNREKFTDVFRKFLNVRNSFSINGNEFRWVLICSMFTGPFLTHQKVSSLTFDVSKFLIIKDWWWNKRTKLRIRKIFCWYFIFLVFYTLAPVYNNKWRWKAKKCLSFRLFKYYNDTVAVRE